MAKVGVATDNPLHGDGATWVEKYDESSQRACVAPRCRRRHTVAVSGDADSRSAGVTLALTLRFVSMRSYYTNTVTGEKSWRKPEGSDDFGGPPGGMGEWGPDMDGSTIDG